MVFICIYSFDPAILSVRIAEYNENIDFSDAIDISDYRCLVSTLPEYMQIDFVDDGKLYTVSYTDYDELVKIIESLRYYPK